MEQRLTKTEAQYRHVLAEVERPEIPAKQAIREPSANYDPGKGAENESKPAAARDGPVAIHIIRGRRVVLDSDLAALYGISVDRLVAQVRLNHNRFPSDFLIHLDSRDVASLKSQPAIPGTGRGRPRTTPALAFTAQGAIMAAMIVKSAHAAQLAVFVIRAFVAMRAAADSQSRVAAELTAMKQSVAALDADTRRKFERIYDAMLRLIGPPTSQH
jgi:hypothetical protein